MANHKSTKKRMRSDKTKNEGNKYLHKTVRNAIKGHFSESDKDKEKKAPKVPQIISMIDKLEKRNVIHKNKAGRLKSKLMKKSS
jgi:small subunit ribosomal protein S20|tara:strand:- start:1249 stop:1500 length:252 start_codon:yes stop_codon:yes gene_type:complete